MMESLSQPVRCPLPCACSHGDKQAPIASANTLFQDRDPTSLAVHDWPLIGAVECAQQANGCAYYDWTDSAAIAKWASWGMHVQSTKLPKKPPAGVFGVRWLT